MKGITYKNAAETSTAFKPLFKCCKCKVPTDYSIDYKGRYYCKRHSRIKPNSPNPYTYRKLENRLPRKIKKMMKFGASVKIYGRKYGKIKLFISYSPKFSGNGCQVIPMSKSQDRELIRIGKA